MCCVALDIPLLPDDVPPAEDDCRGTYPEDDVPDDSVDLDEVGLELLLPDGSSMSELGVENAGNPGFNDKEHTKLLGCMMDFNIPAVLEDSHMTPASTSTSVGATKACKLSTMIETRSFSNEGLPK